MVKNVVCSHCSSLVPADYKSCPNCGASIEIPAPKEEEFKSVQPVKTIPTYSIPPETVESLQSVSSNVFSIFRKSKKILYIALAVVILSLICLCVVSILVISSLQK